MRRVFSAIALVALIGCHDSISGPPDINTNDPRSIIDGVWQDYDRWYAFFPLLPIDWQAVRAAYGDSATRVSPGRETAALLGRMIGQLKDGHAELMTPYGVFGEVPLGLEVHFDWQLLARSYFGETPRRTPSGRMTYARLRDGTGYVYIGSFEGSDWGSDIDVALAAMAPAPTVIIDVRENGGGNENVARDVASRFYDVQRVYRFGRFRSGPAHTDFDPPVAFSAGPAGQHRFRGPVAVLTSRRNGSAAESFVLMMRVLPHAITVGDTTAGVGSNPLGRTLSNGWSYRIPRSQESTPDGFVFNFKGLPPAFPVAWTAEDAAADRDPYVETALQELRRRLNESSR
jgi:hypothetical protein